MFQRNYMFLLNIAFVLLYSSYSNGMNLKIDGNIDLGPKWSYELRSSQLERKRIGMPEIVSKMIDKYAQKKEADDIINQMLKDGVGYNIEPHKFHKQHANEGTADINESTVHKKATQSYKIVKDEEMYVLPRKVKHDPQITEFTKHIYKQSLKVFDAMKEKATDEKLKKKIDFLAQSYEEKFGDFVRETQSQKIKTRLGRQKVIINTLDTSNLILKRLVNYLVGTDKNLLRSEAAANVYQNEVNKKMDIEKTHICKKFGICRTQDGFTAFIIDLITIALNSDDKKIKTLADAFTEVTKYADFSNVMDLNTEKHFRKGIADLETYDVTLLKPILHIVKNVMANKNKPIEVVGEVDKRINKTIGALEIVDAFENALPPNEKNRLEWEDIKNSLVEWREGKRNDIVEITQSFIDHINKGINSFEETTAKSFERNLNLILGSL